MRRRKRSPAPNHDRWLVSYADFITLMFAFFVVMFASSQTDKVKLQAFQTSFSRAVQRGASHSTRPAVAHILGGTVDDLGVGNAMMKGPGGAKRWSSAIPQDVPAELLPPLTALNQTLADEIRLGKLQVTLGARGLVVSFTQTSLFQSGSDRVQPAALQLLERVASVLQTLQNNVLIEGHTDAIPINNGRFRSNWELSAARSIAVMTVLINRFKVDGRRIAIMGRGENGAIDSNASAEGRAKNRRVDIVIQGLTVGGATEALSQVKTP